MFLYEGSEISKEFTHLYSWWTSILVIELMSLIWLTGRVRVRLEIIHSDEDRVWLKNRDVVVHPSGDGHPEVHHLRSVHFNDLAIIISYLLVAPVWLNTDPSPLSVNIYLRLFPISKIMDTLLLLVKVTKIGKSFRYATLGISYFVVICMSIDILL